MIGVRTVVWTALAGVTIALLALGVVMVRLDIYVNHHVVDSCRPIPELLATTPNRIPEACRK